MSKRIKSLKRVKRTINGWPADKIVVFKCFNNAIFYVPDKSAPMKGFTVAIDKELYGHEISRMKDPVNLFTGNMNICLGNLNQRKPTPEELEKVNFWMDYEKYQRCVKRHGMTPWGKRGLKFNEINYQIS